MRLVNRLLALLLATSLIVVCTAIIVESVAGAFDEAPLLLPLDDWKAWVLDLRWSDDVATVISVSIGAVGLLLLLAETWPPRPTGYPMTNPGLTTGDRCYTLGRSGLESHVGHIVETTHPVLGASAHARRQTMKVRVDVPSVLDGSMNSLGEEIGTTVRDELAALPLANQLKVKVKVRRAEERVT